MRILLVEDDGMIGESLRKALRQSQYAVDWAKDGDEADDSLQSEKYDLVILDLGLPCKSGMSVLKTMRERNDTTPVLILTAQDAVADRVKGLDLGADDYMLKPFALEELEARIRVLLRRKAGQAAPVLMHEDIKLDMGTHQMIYKDKAILLSAKEYALLYALIERPGAVLSLSQLESALYGWNEEVSSNAVEVHIHQIRKKTGNKDIIRNIRGVGYVIGGKT